MAREHIITAEQLNHIVELYNGGFTMEEIAKDMGIKFSRVQGAIARARKSNPESVITKKKRLPKKPVIQKEKLTPREMIKALYDLGYRIEDNQLVIYQRQVVKIGDVTKEC